MEELEHNEDGGAEEYTKWAHGSEEEKLAKLCKATIKKYHGLSQQVLAQSRRSR